ncbi:MAG: XRE family transcriptional regulator [Candidatus Magnetoovum sp. WYHC-5]|nr:XRE family transcriptional regulator [Candidatus Magnetoovum sp. WYHC-5]
MTYKELMQTLMAQKGWKRKDLAKHLGKSIGQINQWFTGYRNPGHNTLKQLAFLFNITIDDIENIINDKKNIAEALSIANKAYMVPVISTLNQDSTEDWAPTKCYSASAFGFLIKDNTMEPTFQKNEIAIVDPTADVLSGDIVAVNIKDVLTIAKIHLTLNNVQLIPFSPHILPITINRTSNLLDRDLNVTLQIVGKVVEKYVRF